MPKFSIHVFCFLLYPLVLFAQETELLKVELSLNDRLHLPFFLEKKSGDDLPIYTVINGNERIPLIPSRKNDSLMLSFPEMDSYLMLSASPSSETRGYWQNNIKGQKFPLAVLNKDTSRFNPINSHPPEKIESRYRVFFDHKSNSPWPAVGLFTQNNSSLSGTFLTETGDFRFLEGNVFGNRLFLSCFDGSHAFVFDAVISNDSLIGHFYSGSHYRTEWLAIADDQASIRNPDELTFLMDSSYDLTSIKLTKVNGLKTRLKLGKKTLYMIQVMGTWCPNCLDETKYFKQLYSKYGPKGLEILSIGFEYGKTRREQRKKLRRFVKKAELEYPVFLGGKASKKEASTMFPMLNRISSFPTTLFVTQNGKIVHIHTGFNGPGTGKYYENYRKKTEAFIEEKLKRP